MFKNPFSFDGRIRRSEYALSIIIYILAYAVILALAMGGDSIGLLAVILVIPMVWFGLAQGAKRCHDRGNSGWWQLIPFYGFWMLFADSEVGKNQYGDNPKGIGNQSPSSME